MHLCYYGSSPAEGHQRLMFPNKLFGAFPIARNPSSSSCPRAPRPSISLTLDLIAIPTSPTRPPPTQAPLVAPMLSIAKPIMHQHVRIAFFRSSFDNITRASSLRFDIFRSRSDIIASATHSFRHASVAGAVVSTPGHHFSSLQAPFGAYYLSTTDDRIKQNIAHRVNHQPNPSHTPLRLRPIRYHSTIIIVFFALIIVKPRRLDTPRIDTLRVDALRSLDVRRSQDGDAVKAGTMLRDVMQGMSVPPTANPLLTLFTSFLPAVPRLPVRFYIYFIAYERRSDCFLKPAAYLWLCD